MIRFKFYRFFYAFIFLFSSVMAFGQQTEVMVRAKAKDAKFIGTSIGGAKIFIKDALTGELLAEGITNGSTGNTDKIMKQDRKRGEDISEDSTAGFKAVLDLTEPRFVSIEALAPINKKQARVMSSTQVWLIPGKNITGDGIVLEIPGFVIDIISPQTHQSWSAEKEIKIQANIVMMCGCPISKDGLWDANQYEVKAIFTDADGNSQEVLMEQKDTSSNFEAASSLSKGLYELLIYAYDPVSGNTGVDRTNFIVN